MWAPLFNAARYAVISALEVKEERTGQACLRQNSKTTTETETRWALKENIGQDMMRIRCFLLELGCGLRNTVSRDLRGISHFWC